MQKVQEKFNQKCRAAQGSPLPEWMHDERRVFEWIRRESGITVQRGLELEDLQKRWPEQIPDWAQEQSRGSA
jgi:hypothetical protein